MCSRIYMVTAEVSYLRRNVTVDGERLNKRTTFPAYPYRPLVFVERLRDDTVRFWAIFCVVQARSWVRWF